MGKKGGYLVGAITNMQTKHPETFIIPGRKAEQWFPKDVQVLVPATCEYAALRAKGELRLQMKLRLLIKTLIERLPWIIPVGPME